MPFQKLLLITQLLTLFLAPLRAQFLQTTDAATPPYTPQNLISNVFLGDGVEVVSIQYNGVASAVGYFSGGTQSVGIERGVVMTTGRAFGNSTTSFGANGQGSMQSSVDNLSTAFDADLAMQTTSGLNDVAVYTITFIPTSANLQFRYCFGSEEYPEYACSQYNDVFGFFIQGPNYPTPTNIALIPNTTLPVTINNLHPANPIYNCGALNVQFYNNNNGTNLQPIYDGYTDVFTAEATVIPCQQYTIKLAIADVSDHIFDSGVFLEAKSFGTGSLRAEVTTASLEGVIAEGCSQATITFQLPETLSQDFPIDYNIWGTALNGVDYDSIPNKLVIPAGQQEVVLILNAIEDGQTETPEFLAIDYQRDPCNRDTVTIGIRDNLLQPPSLRADTSVCINSSPLKLDGTLPISLPDPIVFDNSQDIAINPPNTAINSSITVAGVQPATLGPGVIQSVCVNIDHAFVDDIDMYLISPGGQFLELSTDNGGSGDNYTNTCFTPDAVTVISFPGPFAPSTAAPFTGNWLPEGPWTDLWDGNYPTNGQWQLQLRDDANGFVGTLKDWSLTFEPTYKVNYQWFPIGGLSCPTCPVTNADPVQSTVYTVLATDSYGCEVRDSVKVDIIPALEAPVIECVNASAGSVSFNWNQIPNAGGYEVNINGTGWIPNGSNSVYTLSGLAPNTTVLIEVRGIDPLGLCPPTIGAGSCKNCAPPAISIATTPVSCFGNANGSAVISTDNLNPPYNFKLGAQSNTTGVFGNLAAGTYNLVVTDASGCSAQQSIVVNAPGIVSPAININQQVSCFGGDNGSLTANVSGGNSPYNFTWNAPGNPTGSTISNLKAGAYTVTITDASGCTATATATITQPTDLNLSTSAQNVRCFGQANGTALATAQGGVGPYQFQWSNGQSGPTASNLGPGVFTVTVTDANGCAETTFSTIQQPALLSAAASTTPVNCSGDTNGTATVTVQGGVGNYNFVWSDPAQQTGNIATGLSAQVYSVTVTDVNGCVTVTGAVVGSPAPINIMLSPDPVNCFGGSDGSVTADVSGGNGGYNYLWSQAGAPNSATLQGVAAGTYGVTVTDAKGCTASSAISVVQAPALQIAASANNVSCFNSTNGQIALQVQGGTAPFSYLWNNNSNSQNLNNQAPGAYAVTVTDANNCTAVTQATIGAPPPITSAITETPVKCYDGNTGAISITSGGGTGNLTVTWTGPGGFTASGGALSNLPAGVYIAGITDANGCLKRDTAQITQPPFLLLALPDVSDTVCFGATNGTATAAVSGGAPPYQYAWSPGGQNTPSINNLAPNLYRVSITDANGCTAAAPTLIRQKGEVFAFVQGTDPRCHDGTDGTAKVEAVYYGSTLTDLNLFNYRWSTAPAQLTAQAGGLAATQTYSVTVSDSEGCSTVQTVTMGNPEPLIARITQTQAADCHGAATGSAIASGSGGQAPYTYFWNTPPNPQTDSVAVLLTAGTYRVTVTDSKGCYETATATIGEPTPLSASLNATTVSCYDGADGTAQILVSGGTPSYQIDWSNGSSGNAISGLRSGGITATVTDANGCFIVRTTEIRQPDAPLSGSAIAEDVSCFGSQDGRIQITGAGGTPPYRYALNGGAPNGSSVQIGLNAGAYTPILIDIKGCTLTLPAVNIGQPPAIVLDLGPDITVTLSEGVQLSSQITNAEEPVIYSWDRASEGLLSCMDCPDPYIDSIYYPHVFTLAVEDARGCLATDQIKVLVDKPRRIHVPTGFTPNNDGNNDRLIVHGQADARILDFRVYDRWGELVYQATDFPTNDPASGWDGAYRDRELDPGIFVWILEAQFLDGAKEVFKGNTALIR
jgi:gliding motility-associated-like protein